MTSARLRQLKNLSFFSLFLAGLTPLFAEDPKEILFLKNGEDYLKSKSYPEALEAFKTAIKMNPSNTEAWNFYDQTLEASVREKIENQKFPTLEGDRATQPFSLEFVNSYQERDSVIIFGAIKNKTPTLLKSPKIEIYLQDKSGGDLKKIVVESRMGSVGIEGLTTDRFEYRVHPIPFQFNKFRVILKNP